VAKYTEQIDAQITQLLQTRGQVTGDMLAGVTEEEARSFLSFYVSTHPEIDVVFDGTILQPTPAEPSPAAPVPQTEPGTATGEAAGLAAVASVRAPAPDETPGYRGSSTGSYDPYDGIQPIPEARTYPVHKALWLLPLFFGLLGGIIGWAVTRDKNPTAARTMLVVGTIVMISSACISFSLGGIVSGGAGSGATDTGWPATATTTFYYFGIPD